MTGYSEVKVSCGLVPTNALVLSGLANFHMVGYSESAECALPFVELKLTGAYSRATGLIIE